MKTHYLNLKIDPAQIHFLHCIFEGHGGMAVVRTIDSKQGLVQVWVMPDFLDETKAVLTSISDEINLVSMKTGDKMYAG